MTTEYYMGYYEDCWCSYCSGIRKRRVPEGTPFVPGPPGATYIRDSDPSLHPVLHEKAAA